MHHAARAVPAALLITLALLMGRTVLAETCDFLPRDIQPEWTYESPQLEGFYVGVGLAEADGAEGRLGADEQIEQARQSAVADLASSIKVSVRSSLAIEMRSRRSAGFESADMDVTRMTETITDTSLRDVMVDQTWLDREHCIVWMRVRISRAEVAAMEHREIHKARLARLDAHYAGARDRSASPHDREAALQAAYAMLDEIDFPAIKKSKTYYQRLLDNLASKVQKSVGGKQQTETLRADAEALLLRAKNSSSSNERKKLTVDAIATLRAIIAANPIGERPGQYDGEAAAFRIAEIEKARNNSCAAQLQYEIVRDRSSSDKWVGDAQAQLAGVRCTRRNRKAHTWRRSFDGVRTTFACAYEVNGEISDWDKPCENIDSFLQSYGALSGADIGISPSKLAELVYNMDKDAQAAAALADSGRVILFLAKGNINQRDNKENPNGRDYQFSGKIYSYLVDNGKIEFDDEYSATGGWNPVSEAMTMDVIGLNVAGRWKSAYLKHLKAN